MNNFVIIVGLIGLALPTFTKGGLELDQLQTQQQKEDCPVECFCDKVVLFATCTGDASKTFLPSLSWLGTDARMRRIEIHDFVLGDLIVDSKTHYKLFRFIEELHMSHNQITLIHYLLTDPLASESYATASTANNELNLLLLDLSFNNLTYFESIAEYRVLKVLDLSHNRIHRLQLNGLEKLESLNLKSNDIEELSQDIFQSLKSIQYINLDSNRLKKLHPNLFSNLPSLAHLILSSNPFQLDRTSVLLNARTQFIDVSNVGLDHIPPVMFGTVRDLRLNNNKLKRILESDFESYPNVGLLVLDENQIEIIENDAFGRMDFLTSLWLNGNRLSSIPQNLPSSLTSLQLEENRITTLNTSSFASLHNLEHLNLHLNQITAVEPDVLASLHNLVTLNLGTNLIDTIYRDSFRNLSKLTVLDLSGNPIKVLVNGAFTHVPQLHALHLARISENEIEFDASIFDSLSSLQLLDLSSSKNFTRQIVDAQCFSRGWLKSLRELNIERCDLRIELSLLCSQLMELDSLVTVRVQGNSFNTSTSTNTSTSVMLAKKVVTAANNSDNENDNLNSSAASSEWSSSSTPVQRLCPSATRIEGGQGTTRARGKGDETSFVDLDRERKVSLTLTTITTTKSPTASASASSTTASINVTISSNKDATTTTITRSSNTTTTRPASRLSSTNIKHTMEEGPAVTAPAPPTSSSSTTSTSTSSYFDPPPWSKSGTRNKHQETNEDASQAIAVGLGSIDGFPAADLSGRTTISNTFGGSGRRSSGGGNSTSTTFVQDQEHNDDFAKGSFHGIFPQKMYLAHASALAASSGGSAATVDENSSKSLILKTILISAGTCLLSVFALLGFGLLLFRLNGGRFVRSARTRTREITNSTTDSYTRLEDKQELELGISNRMYYESGQVYHIS